MEFSIELLEKLLKDKKAEIQTGVFLCCDKGLIKPTVSLNNDNNVVIEFEAPFTYLHVEKLGPKRLLNLIKPRIESVTITPKSFNVKLSSLGIWEFER
jgi:hypothetical protein